MSVGRSVQTTLSCDMVNCRSALTWDTADYLPTAQAEKAARSEGWRKDKLGRHVCAAHPKLRGARRG